MGWNPLKKLKNAGEFLIRKGLPTLGKAIGLGGPAEAVASMLGLGPDANEKDFVNAIQNMTPDQYSELKKYEMDHEVELQQIELEYYKVQLQDVHSARQREIELTKTTGKRDYNLYVLAWTVVIGFLTLTGLMYSIEMPQANIGPANQLLGMLATGFGMVLAYFFGSSAGSKRKTEQQTEIEKMKIGKEKEKK